MKTLDYFLETCIDVLDLKSFRKLYNDTFEVLRCDTDALMHKALRLRHEVYCKENGFECPAIDNDYLEKDEYDDHAVHFVLRRRTSNETAGTLRLILPNDERPDRSFPMQKHMPYPLLQDDLQALTMCEISRFCMAKRFRSRVDDGKFLSSYHDQDIKAGFKQGKMTFIRRRIAYPPAALLGAAFEAAMQARIMDVLWMVEPRHLLSLDQIGLPYQRLGDRMEVHGGLIPIAFNIKHVLDQMHRRSPACWEIISDDGRLQDIADDLYLNDWQDRLMVD